EEGGVDPTTLTQLPPYHVWASMVGQNGDKIPPFSMRVRPPLEASEEQIQAALDARANYSTPVKVASKEGRESLTYIRDSFGRVLSEGGGRGAAPVDINIRERASASGNKMVDSLLSDIAGPDDESVIDPETPLDNALLALLELEDDARNI
ncbi:MAG: hypothetical protein KAU23_08865, partial [Anaerolineales bacterium]|nr:hypothetical protein [Anaerolineales bacterium]